MIKRRATMFRSEEERASLSFGGCRWSEVARGGGWQANANTSVEWCLPAYLGT